MKKYIHITLGFLLALAPVIFKAQTSNSPSPYCAGNYSSGQCNQGGPSNTPGNSVNDFINTFITSGGSNNISNVNSGCNGGPGNYINYCQYYLSASPGQVITCTLQSGIIYSQGFSIWVDWNQDNAFTSLEQVAATTNAPSAGSFVNLSFTIPPGQANGAYRIRVRCAFSTPGTQITPCGQFGYGETEDYTLYIGGIPSSSPVVTATVTGNDTICRGQAINLGIITSPSAVTYTWTGPNSFTSTLQNPVINNAPSAASGVYTVVTSGACPARGTVTVLVAPDPNFSITPANPVICQGNHFTAAVAFTTVPSNVNQFSYAWSCNVPPGTFLPGGFGAGIYSPATYSTVIGPGTIPTQSASLTYTIVVTPTLMSCPVTHTMQLIINNPITPVLSLPLTLCNTANPVMLTATPGGGTWSANPAVGANGSFSATNVPLSAIGINTVSYAVSVGTCIVNSTGTISVSQFNPPTLTNSVSTLCYTLDPPFNLMNIVQDSTHGSWVNSAFVQNNYFIPTGLATGNYSVTYSTVSSPIASVCPASTVLVIPVFHAAAPVISPIASRCNNSPTVQLTASPNLNLLWTGNAGVSSSGVLSPTFCNTGLNTVFCTGGAGTCVATGSTTFSISIYHTAAFTGTVPNLCVSNNAFNLLSIVQDAQGIWSGISTANNIFDPVGLSGVYTLTYSNHSFPDPDLCPESHTIAVSVSNPATPNIAQVGPYCNIGGPVQLTVTPHVGSWIPSSYLTSGGLFTPSLCPVGSNIVQYVIGTSTCNAAQSASINVEAFVPATISGTVPDQCTTNSPLNLLPFTLTNLGTWSGPGILGSGFNPGVTGTGNIIISYNTASSPSGLCPDQATVAVNVYSLATPVFSRTGPLCNSFAPLKLLVSPVGGIFGGINTSSIDRDGIFSPATALIGNNIINYSITSGPCVAYAQTTVVIERFVAADFISSAGPFCKNDPRLGRNLNELVLNPGGAWSGPGMTGSLFTFTNANIGNNNIIAYQTHSLPTATLCPDTSEVRIQVYDTPQVLALSNINQGCLPAQVMLNTPSFNTGVGTWDFGDGTDPEDGLSLNHTYTTPGSYSVTFTYSLVVAADFACVAQAHVANAIKIYETPKADFTYAPDVILISDPEVHFTNTSSGINTSRFQWTITGTAENTSYEIDPHITFPKVGDYKVKLSAVSLNGCKSEITKTVSVKTEFDVFIPTAFTPNGDEHNNTFFPVFTDYGLDARTYEFEIFDRWGTHIFESKDINTGWDGKKGGQPLKQDVYIYRLKYKDLDGTVYNKTGYVTLMR